MPPDFFNFFLQVEDVKTVLERSQKPNAKPMKITECLVGDETGTIILPARNEQGEDDRKQISILLPPLPTTFANFSISRLAK